MLVVQPNVVCGKPSFWQNQNLTTGTILARTFGSQLLAKEKFGNPTGLAGKFGSQPIDSQFWGACVDIGTVKKFGIKPSSP
jgi:hypothetical protein